MAQNGVAELIDGLTEEFRSFPASAERSDALKKALSDYGKAITSAEGTLDEQAARVIAAEAAVVAELPKSVDVDKQRKEGDNCDVNEVRELLGALRIIDDGIAAAPADGGGIGGVQTGGGVKEFLLDLRNAVLKCLGRCGRKVGAAANSLGDLVIALFDPESVRRRQAARAALPAVGDDALVQEGAVIAGELAVIGVTAGLGGAFDPLYEPLKALLLPMLYGAVVGIPSFIMALGRRLIAMGVVGCAGGALTLFGLLQLALIRRTAMGVVSAAGAAAGVVAGSPDAILDALNLAAKASAYAVYKKLGVDRYNGILADAKNKLIAAMKLPEAALAAAAAEEHGAGAGAAAAAAEAGEPGAGAAAAAVPPAAALQEGVIEQMLAAAPGEALSLAGKITRASKIAMSKVAGGTVDAVNGTRALIAALTVGVMRKYYGNAAAGLEEVADNLDGAFGELDGARLAEIPEVREAVAAAAAMPAAAAAVDAAAPAQREEVVRDAALRVEAAAGPPGAAAGSGAAAAAAAAAAAPAAAMAVDAVAAAEAAAEAGSGAASKRPRSREEEDEDQGAEGAAGPRPNRRRTVEPAGDGAAAPLPGPMAGVEGGHRCPKCGSDMVDRVLGVQKPKRKTRRAAPKKVKKSKKSKTSKKGGSYRKNRKMSEKRHR